MLGISDRLPCATLINPPPMIIIIKKFDPCPVLFPNPLIDNVKIQGHRVEQNNPTEIKANKPIVPPKNIPEISITMPAPE